MLKLLNGESLNVHRSKSAEVRYYGLSVCVKDAYRRVPAGALAPKSCPLRNFFAHSRDDMASQSVLSESTRPQGFYFGKEGVRYDLVLAERFHILRARKRAKA